MGLYDAAQRAYYTAIRNIGHPSSLVRLLPDSWIRKHTSFQDERRAKQKTENERNWLEAQLADAISYLNEVREQARDAVQRRGYEITKLESLVQEKEKQIKTAKAKIAKTKTQLNYTGHWKHDVAKAGQVLLQTRAKLESATSRISVVIAADHRDSIVYASSQALRLFGYTNAEQIKGRNVYTLLQGTGRKNSTQIKLAVKKEIAKNRPEKVSLPNALLIRSENRKPVGANMTILPIFAGETYIGSVVRGESREEKKARIEIERAAIETEKKKSKSIIENALSLFGRPRPIC
jgi:PAS domain-containing protein